MRKLSSRLALLNILAAAQEADLVHLQVEDATLSLKLATQPANLIHWAMLNNYQHAFTWLQPYELDYTFHATYPVPQDLLKLV